MQVLEVFVILTILSLIGAVIWTVGDELVKMYRKPSKYGDE